MKRLLYLLFLFTTLNALAQQKNITGKVLDSDGKEALPGVSILVKGTNTGATTNADGTFELAASPNDVLILSFIGYAQQEIPVGESEVLELTLTKTDLSLDEVVVVGSRSGQARSKIATPVPVDIISAKELTATGRTEITQILNFVAPSIVSNRQPGGDGTAHIDPVALRGIAPDQTLVLVNGKRRHGSALVNVLGTPSQGSVAVDFNAIPVAAIERIEVLRDGAAAQYGSDAIAGVVNIVLKSNVNNVQVSATSGAHVTSYRDKTDGSTLQADVNYGFKIGKAGYINLTGQINNREATDRGGFYEFNNRLTKARQYWYSYAAGTEESVIQAKEASVDRYSSARSGNGEQNGSSLFFNASLPFGDGAEFYAFGGASSRFSVSPNNAYRFPNGTANPVSISSRYIPALFPDGFLPENVARITDKSFTTGIKGKKSGWDIDLSNSYGSNRVAYTVRNSLNVSLGTASPKEASSGALQFGQNTTNLGLFRKFENIGFLKSIGIAFGGEYRIETYQIIAGEERSYRNYRDTTYITTMGGTTKGVRPAGIQAFPGYQPSDEQDRSRHNIGAYGDVEVEVTDRLLLTGALRYEDYSDFGDQWTWKTSGLLKIVDGQSTSLALRGAVSTGFRAPSLQQQFYSATTSIPQGDGSLILSLMSNNANPVTQSFGVPQLTAETSNNLSAGITARLFRNFTATIDAYQIDIENRVTLTGFFDFNSINSTNETVKGAAQLVKGLLVNYPDVNSAQFFANAIDTRTCGVDVVLSYRNEVGPGFLSLSAAANFTETEVQNVRVPSGLTSTGTPEVRQYLSERIFFDRLQRTRYERGTPQNKFIASVGYTWGKFSPNVVVTRFGEYTIAASQSQLDNPNGNRDQTFSPQVVTDVALSYRIAKAVTLTAGANNVGDIYPDQQRVENNQTGSIPWGTSAGQQFGFNGAFYYGRLIFSF